MTEDRITVVDGAELGLPATHTCVDVRLVESELAEDALFTEESSVPSGDKKRWCSLRERIAAQQMGQIRETVATLLAGLTPKDAHWIWFADRVQFTDKESPVAPDEYNHPENHDTLRGFLEDAPVFFEEVRNGTAIRLVVRNELVPAIGR